MSFLQLILINLAAVVVAMGVMWVISIFRRDTSIVDPFWGFGFVILAWISCGLLSDNPRAWLLMAMVSVWGLRLSAYLLWRNHGEPEDRRYVAMREHYGEAFWWKSIYVVFGLQGAIMWLVSLTFQAGMFYGDPELGWLDALGVCVWLVGLFFESVGDYQMARFRANPENKGRVMDRGLWRFTRHPNYFGDFCIWWGVYLVAVAAGAWWTIFAPLGMSFLLVRVSGVRLLESDIADRRPEYRRYQERTNAFLPWFPKTAPASEKTVETP